MRALELEGSCRFRIWGAHISYCTLQGGLGSCVFGAKEPVHGGGGSGVETRLWLGNSGDDQTQVSLLSGAVAYEVGSWRVVRKVVAGSWRAALNGKSRAECQESKVRARS